MKAVGFLNFWVQEGLSVVIVEAKHFDFKPLYIFFYLYTVQVSSVLQHCGTGQHLECTVLALENINIFIGLILFWYPVLGSDDL